MSVCLSDQKFRFCVESGKVGASVTVSSLHCILFFICDFSCKFLYNSHSYVHEWETFLHYNNYQGFFAYFIADTGSYSQLKMVSFFPSSQEKIPNFKCLIKTSKIFETWTTSLVLK